MVERCQERILWMEQNLLPVEPEIRNWLRRKRVSDVEIDDIVQEVYARIGSMDDLTRIHTPRTYAFHVARSILLNNVRRPHIVLSAPNGDLDLLGVASPDINPEEVLTLKEQISEVVTTITALPKRTRDVLLLRRVEGLSQRETADRLAIAEKTVEKHLARAVLVLMKEFGRGGKTGSRTSTIRPTSKSGNGNGIPD
jgi:RNA polymerase sigma factor (sigma-70 family)